MSPDRRAEEHHVPAALNEADLIQRDDLPGPIEGWNPKSQVASNSELPIASPPVY